MFSYISYLAFVDIFSVNLLSSLSAASSASSVNFSVMPFGINGLLICSQIFAGDYRGNICGYGQCFLTPLL